MKSQKKVKAFLGLAVLIIISLFTVVGLQLFNIIKIQNKIDQQNKTIEQLQDKLDYYQNKNSGETYEEII